MCFEQIAEFRKFSSARYTNPVGALPLSLSLSLAKARLRASEKIPLDYYYYYYWRGSRKIYEIGNVFTEKKK